MDRCGKEQGAKGAGNKFPPNVSLSSRGKEHNPGLISYKCLTKLHAAKRPPLSTSRSKATGNKLPSKYFRMPIQKRQLSSHKCLTNSKLNLSAHTNFSLSSKGRESHSHLASHKCLTKLHAAKRPPLSTSRSKGTGHKFPSTYQNANSKASAHTHVSLLPN